MKTWYYDETCKVEPAVRARMVSPLLKKREGRTAQAKYGVGHVVEFTKGGEHRCGVLLSDRPRYLRVIDQDGKETTVHREKVVDISRQMLNPWGRRNETSAKLREIARHREELRQALEVRALWELTSESGPRDWSLAELVELHFGEGVGDDERCALARALDAGPPFERRGQKFRPLPQREVADHDRADEEARLEEQWMQEAAAWLRGLADGESVAPPQGSERAIRLLEGEAIHGANNPDVERAAALMKLAHLHGPHAAFEVLVKMGHWQADENLDLLRHEIPSSFPAEVIEEAEGCGWSGQSRRSPRHWFGRTYGLSREGGECDRAISLRRRVFGYTVGIHFASPALMVDSGGHVQREVADRGVSVRLPDRTVPLIPQEIASRARLTTEEVRPALTVEVRVSSQFEVEGYTVLLRRARVTDALTFDEADSRLEGDERLRKLHRFAQGLRASRQDRGAIIIPEPELEFSVVDGEVDIKLVDTGAPSRLIASELTIFANALVGEFCEREGIPAIFRTEPAPKENLIVGEEYDPVACRRQKLLMLKARLGLDAEPHRGLGVGLYAPVDSPRHRHSDFLMHQQLAQFIESREPKYTTEELRSALLHSAWGRDASGEIEARARRYWMLKYMEQRVGKEVEAVVLERYRAGCLVQFCDCLLWTFVPADHEVRLSPGDKVLVTVNRVSARRDVVRATSIRKIRDVCRPG